MKSIICPKCNKPNNSEDLSGCPQCGIIYSSYLKSMAKQFNETIKKIGDIGLDKADDEFQHLIDRFPKIEKKCESYLSAINHALVEYSKENYKTSNRIFNSIIEKQPHLKKAVEPYLKSQESLEDDKAFKINRNSPSNEIDENKSDSILKKADKLSVNNIKTSGYIALAMFVIFLFFVFAQYESGKYIPPAKTKSYSYSKGYTATSPSDSPSNSSDFSDNVVLILNRSYGNVCRAELNGFFSKTLKIDWTRNTNKFDCIKVLGEIGSVKEQLYKDGVRYFQFPNDAGTYNVIDWKTGEKKSTSERAKYYFPD